MESLAKLKPSVNLSFNQELASSRQKKYISSELSPNQKMELYNCGVKGDLEKLKTLINIKHYNLMEECSAHGYYWTVLHYACHYGFYDIVEYALEYYSGHKDKLAILNLQSNLGMSPLLIAINNLSNEEQKKKIIELYIEYDCIDYDVCTMKNEDIFSLCAKNRMLDFFLSMLKED